MGRDKSGDCPLILRGFARGRVVYFRTVLWVYFLQ
jgi:hypothetical protein